MVAAPLFRITRVLTDRGSCFTADGFERACRGLGILHRKTRPYTPRTNGKVGHFNGRVQREVLDLAIALTTATSSACWSASARREPR